MVDGESAKRMVAETIPRLLATYSKPARPAAPAQAAAPAEPKRKLSRKALVAGAALAVLVAGGWYGHYYWTAGRYLVATDDG